MSQYKYVLEKSTSTEFSENHTCACMGNLSVQVSVRLFVHTLTFTLASTLNEVYKQ